MKRQTKSVRILKGDAQLLKLLAVQQDCTIGDIIHASLISFTKERPSAVEWLKTQLGKRHKP